MRNVQEIKNVGEGENSENDRDTASQKITKMRRG